MLPLAACGSTGAASVETTADQFSISPGSIGDCLIEAGASHAEGINDVPFLFEAEADDDLSKTALAVDRKAKAVVRIWMATPRNGRAPRWIVWFSQPYGMDSSPTEILESGGISGYVLFINDPTLRVRRQTASCIRLGNGRPDPTVHLHSVR
jgi:hypothetical protein